VRNAVLNVLLFRYDLIILTKKSEEKNILDVLINSKYFNS